MFPDGDTKFASLTATGGAKDGNAAAAGDEAKTAGAEPDGGATTDGASPKAAFVDIEGVADRVPGASDVAEQAVRAATNMITPHNPAQPRAAVPPRTRAAAMPPPKAE
jgi:hypothetical protein